MCPTRGNHNSRVVNTYSYSSSYQLSNQSVNQEAEEEEAHQYDAFLKQHPPFPALLSSAMLDQYLENQEPPEVQQQQQDVEFQPQTNYPTSTLNVSDY